MSTRLRCSLAALALAFFGLHAAQAQDAEVPGNFGTISAAVQNASDTNGDGVIEILVRSGVYNENVQIQRSNLLLRGEDAATTRLEGVGGNDTLRVRDANGVTVADLTVVGVAAGASNDAVDFNRSDDCRVDGVITEGGDTGIDISNAQGCRLVDSVASGARTEGVKIQRSSDVLIIRSASRDNGHQGFDVDASDNVRVGRNTATGNGDSGFRDRNSSGNKYGENTSTGNVDDGFRVENSNNTLLIRNTALDNLSNGLRLDETTNTDVFDNAFTDNNEWGVRRKDTVNDDFNGNQAGNQDSPGDNDLSGNRLGPVRND